MSIEQEALNDATQKKPMKDDPNWTQSDRDKYYGTYNSEKQKLDDEDMREKPQG